jgi:hypothetical protein
MQRKQNSVRRGGAVKRDGSVSVAGFVVGGSSLVSEGESVVALDAP